MAGWSVHLDVPQTEETTDTIVSFYRFVEQKRDQYCENVDALRVEERRQRDLNRLEEDGLFLVYAPVYKKLREQITWSEIEALIDTDWTVASTDIEALISIFRLATTEIATDDEWDYRCFSETGVIAICEFAREHGYSVKILD